MSRVSVLSFYYLILASGDTPVFAQGWHNSSDVEPTLNQRKTYWLNMKQATQQPSMYYTSLIALLIEYPVL